MANKRGDILYEEAFWIGLSTFGAFLKPIVLSMLHHMDIESQLLIGFKLIGR